MKQLPTGPLAPDFRLRTLKEETFHLKKAIADRPVVLAFYKASCPTSQLTFPYLQRIYAELGDRLRLRICGISQDEVSETQDFVREFGIGFEILMDEHPYDVSAA